MLFQISRERSLKRIKYLLYSKVHIGFQKTKHLAIERVSSKLSPTLKHQLTYSRIKNWVKASFPISVSKMRVNSSVLGLRAIISSTNTAIESPTSKFTGLLANLAWFNFCPSLMLTDAPIFVLGCGATVLVEEHSWTILLLISFYLERNPQFNSNINLTKPVCCPGKEGLETTIRLSGMV